MAKTTVSELQVLISANAASFQAQLDAVKKQMASMGAASNSMGSKLGAGLKGTIVKYAGLGAAITGAYKAMRTASSYIEDENLFAVSMNKAADFTRAWSDQVERSVGVSGAWLRKYTGVMTNMTQSMGLSHDTAAKLGKNVALLSQDIASFYNISPEAAFEKMQSAMAGMPRPLQELGIMVRDQELEQTALAMGIRKTNGEFTSAQKALLTYETVIRSTKNAQGDLARTLNTPANQMRMLTTNARNLGVAIGTMFQPLLSVVLPALNAIIMAATSAIRALAGLFGIEFKADAGGIGEVASGVGGIGEAADKAGGKVKKLKGQLASFDEMNTLQEQDSGGGSGGGGGAGTLPTMDWSKYNAGLDNAKNKAVAMAEAIKKFFKDFGKGFDFAKIGNAFKRFFNDTNKFIEPIGKIIGDLWGYFKPFIYWTGNDLLPAFLNALGGAINFVGAVIGRVWDSFLKPFVDMFLMPIASFTGGVIVWTLNAIGDGLRWIAEQEGAVTTVSNLMAIVGTGIAIWQGYQFVIGVVAAAQLAMNGVMVAGTAASGAYAAGIGAVTVAQNLAATASTLFSSVLTTVTNPAFLAVAAVATAAVVAFEAFKLAQAESKLKEEQRIDTVKLSTQTQNWHTEAIEGTKRALDELSGKKMEANEAELAYMRSVDRAKEARKLYNEAVKQGRLSVDDLRKLELEAIIAEGKSEEAKKKLEQAQNGVTEAIKTHENQQWKAIMAQEQGRLMALAQKGDYGKLSDELQKLAKSEQYYTDEHGRKTRMSKDDTRAMAEFIGDQLAKINDGNGKAWKGIWDKADRSVDQLKNLSPKIFENAKVSGENFGRGVQQGIANRNNDIYRAGWNQADQGMKGFNARLKIHSPSRVMMKQAGFFSAGIINGLKATTSMVRQASSSLAGNMADAFNESSLDNIVAPDFAKEFNKDVLSASGSIGGEIRSVVEANAPHVTVNIGPDTIVDRIVEAINQRSMMKNQTVIDI
jgi:hypothetical protein|nr:MAG TPA: minor tail protein [Caudoviricetes sp.]